MRTGRAAVTPELHELAGRSRPERSDGRDSRARLVAAVNAWVAEHGVAPTRLADVADLAGLSTATAYRHFASVDDAIQAFVLQLPVRAIERFAASAADDETPVDRFRRWNRAWVDACLEHGELAVRLRSPIGFLERRRAGDPVLAHLCATLDPVLDALTQPPATAGEVDSTLLLFTWNVVSDPREVLDLTKLGWTPDRVADFVTDVVLAVAR